MKEISVDRITKAVRNLAMDASHHLEPDILEALLKARDREEDDLAKNILDMLLANADIASRECIPVCQDTGMGVVFVFMGDEVMVRGDLDEAIQKGVRAGYREGYLRNSVSDPITRKNTGDNTPAVIHLERQSGADLRLCFLPKGCGSENMSSLAMLPPAAGVAGIRDFVVSRVLAAGSNPCPPGIVGVGIGGTFEKAAILAKKALLRPVGMPNGREDVARLEEQILAQINRDGLGVEGFGGVTTMLAVHIETFPTHIASLPVAVNMQCHAHRHKEILL